ncbi:hypothetical protein Fmac_002604 [Flemingia macrophylla]|uniref:Uncharacterized protein n=1 Tax=Flemingia macrophylla TaxID=520843 RepID=A0ABD1NKG8_9FABA
MTPNCVKYNAKTNHFEQFVERNLKGLCLNLSSLDFPAKDLHKDLSLRGLPLKGLFFKGSFFVPASEALRLERVQLSVVPSGKERKGRHKEEGKQHCYSKALTNSIL